MIVDIIKANKTYIVKHSNNIIFNGIVERRWFNVVKILKQNEKIISEIKTKIKFPFKINYIISFTDSTSIILKFHSFFNQRYECYFDNNKYELFPHRGRKMSIFENDIQIGFYQSRQLEFMGRHTITLNVNDNVNLSVILSFILAISCDFDNDYSTFSFDFGNIGPGMKKNNPDWKPNLDC